MAPEDIRCLLAASVTPVSAQVFGGAMSALFASEATIQRRPLDGVILFRTYNAEGRRQHADSETVLVAEGYSDMIYGILGRSRIETNYSVAYIIPNMNA